MTLAGTNTWLLSHGDGFHVVIDPGPLMHEERIMSMTQGRISAILLTHRHADHTACAAALAARSHAPVLAMDPEFASNANGILCPDQELRFDELNLRVIATPGHTSDSVAFLATSGDEVALFTGDTILGDGSSIITFPDGDLGAYLHSLDTLESAVHLKNKLVPLLPGHGRTHDDSLPLIAKYRTHRLERLAQIRAVMAEGVTDAEGIVNRVYSDVAENLRLAALMTVEAQLAYLNERA